MPAQYDKNLQDDWSKACTCAGGLGRKQRQASGQKEDGHQGEGDQSQSAATLGVNQEQGGNGEDNLDRAVTQRGEQSLVRVVQHVLKDCRAVERDNCKLSVYIRA